VRRAKGSAPFTTGASPYTERVRWKPFRITELWAKIAYIIVGWWVLPFSLRPVMAIGGIPAPAIVAFEIATSLGVVWLGTRAFRIQGEPVEPARVWWRATGRPRAGFVLGGFFLWGFVVFLTPPEVIVDPLLPWFAVPLLPIGLFYLHSSIRLVRGHAPVPPRPRRNDDLKLIGRKQRF
jgi:hypothetical protein